MCVLIAPYYMALATSASGWWNHHEAGVIRRALYWNDPVQSESCLCLT